MPRRKQDHLSASKRVANCAGRPVRRGTKTRSSNVRATAASYTPRRRGRGASRSRGGGVKGRRVACENVGLLPLDTKPRYLHKKFQRADCRSPSINSDQHGVVEEVSAERSFVSPDCASSSSRNSEHRTAESDGVKSSTKALEALLQVTELEIHKSSTENVTLPKSSLEVDSDAAKVQCDIESRESCTVASKLRGQTNSSEGVYLVNAMCSPKSDVEMRHCIVGGLKTKSSPDEPIECNFSSRSASISPKEESEPKKMKLCRHVCTYCSHAFAKPSVLKKHIRAHTNERPYPCRLCGFSFKTKSNLYKHCKSRTHVSKVRDSGRTVDEDTTLADASAAVDSNDDTDDEMDKVSDSDNSCDGVLESMSVRKHNVPKSVPVGECVRSSASEHVAGSAKDGCVEGQRKRVSSASSETNFVKGNPRVPPIKIQALFNNRQTPLTRTSETYSSQDVMDTRFSSGLPSTASITVSSHQLLQMPQNPNHCSNRTSSSSEISASRSPISDVCRSPSGSSQVVAVTVGTPVENLLTPSKHTSGVSTIIYKPKFHSAIIGGSRKFIDQKNFSLDLSRDENRASPSESTKSNEGSYSDGQERTALSNEVVVHRSSPRPSSDGLMLRVLESNSNISTEQGSTVQSHSSNLQDVSVLQMGSETTSALIQARNIQRNSQTESEKLKSVSLNIVSAIRPVADGGSSPAVISPGCSSATPQFAARNPLKSPRLASPEFLKQHISNLISRNTAIVETLNPLWSRRFLRQSSVASSQNVDAELRARDKHRHFGGCGVGEDLSQSKLANALLRKGDGIGLPLTGSQSLPATPSVILSSPAFANVLLAEVKNQLYNLGATSNSPQVCTPATPAPKDAPPTFIRVTGPIDKPALEVVPEERQQSSKNVIVTSVHNSCSNKSEITSSDVHVYDDRLMDHDTIADLQQHPQNPEGSIIKNLLLTKRPSSSLAAPAAVSPSIRYASSTLPVDPEHKQISDRCTDAAQVAQESHSKQLHTCSFCCTSFGSIKTLQAHQAMYCQKNNRASSACFQESSEVYSAVGLHGQTDIYYSQKILNHSVADSVPKPRGRPKGSKNRPKEVLVICPSPTACLSPSNQYLPLSPTPNTYTNVASPSLNTENHGKTLNALKGKLNYRQGNGVNETSDNRHPEAQTKFPVNAYSTVELTDTENEEEGPILKKHLLCGLAGDKSPPLKKRKVPEGAVANDTLTSGSAQRSSVSTLRSLEELSRYPMRNSAIQLFGGEVQIYDGGETTKMRVDTKSQHPVPSGGGLVVAASSASSSMPLHLLPMLGSGTSSSVTVEEGGPSAAVVVTIAKPVLNSGGTVTQVQDSKSHKASPVCIPVVAIGQPVVSCGMMMAAEGGTGISSLAADLGLPSSRLSKYNEMGAVVLSANISTSSPEKSSRLRAIDISHLQINPHVSLHTPQPPGSPLLTGMTSTNTQLRQTMLMSPKPLLVSLPVSSPGLGQRGSSPLAVNTSGGSTTTIAQSGPLKVVVTGSCFSSSRTQSPSCVTSIKTTRPSVNFDLVCNELLLRQEDASQDRATVVSTPTLKLSTSHMEQGRNESKSSNEKSEVPSLKLSNVPTIQIQLAREGSPNNCHSSASSSTSPHSTSKATCPTTSSIPSSSSTSESSKTYLAPPRPTTLPLKSLHSSMVGTTLISPETPRPKKKYGQLYINGQYYTYLGLKCSTRVYYCCIYRPQPMYVPQSTDSKLSMYSNWQTVPANPDPLNLTPSAAMAFYDSRHRPSRYVIAGPKNLDYILTHSSYWTFKQQKKITKDRKAKAKEASESKIKPKETVEEETVETCDEVEVSKATVVSVKTDPASASHNDESVSSETSTASSSVKQKCKEGSEGHREPKRVKIFEGGFKSNEEYTYVRGRGRGKYVCEECGIRCKKPSMLKKHIRTHTDVRPFTCKHCNFSFKTKGNLTKHMKSKAHHKKCIELGIDPVPVSIDDAHIDEEALAKQERYEREHGQFADDDDDDTDEDFDDDEDDDEDNEDEDDEDEDEDSLDDESSDEKPMSTSATFAPKGQFEDALEAKNRLKSDSISVKSEDHVQMIMDCPAEQEAARSLLDLSNHGQPGHLLPSCIAAEGNDDSIIIVDSETPTHVVSPTEALPVASKENPCKADEELIGNPRVVWHQPRTVIERGTGLEHTRHSPVCSTVHDEQQQQQHIVGTYPVYLMSTREDGQVATDIFPPSSKRSSPAHIASPYTIGDTLMKHDIYNYCEPATNSNSNLHMKSPENGGTRIMQYSCSTAVPVRNEDVDCELQPSEADDYEQPMDLSVGSGRPGAGSPLGDPKCAYPLEEGDSMKYSVLPPTVEHGKSEPMYTSSSIKPHSDIRTRLETAEMYEAITPPPAEIEREHGDLTSVYSDAMSSPTYARVNGARMLSSNSSAQRWEARTPEASSNSMLHAYLTEKQVERKSPAVNVRQYSEAELHLSPSHSKPNDYPIGSPPVASSSSAKFPQYLSPGANKFRSSSPGVHSTSHDGEAKLHCEFLSPTDGKPALMSHRTRLTNLHYKVTACTFPRSMDDGKCVCNICDKSFTKPSQLRLHVNIHYFERPFRCDSCAVSFRTKGHLQKHRRSVSHYNKVNMNMTFGTPTTDNPRPFKCGDCKIAFRIHGHLAKHLRSKMHIMKLECLGKLPFGTYAEIERSGVNLNEIDTTDCENSLESLQVMAQRLDPGRQRWPRERTVSGCSADDGSDASHVTDESLEGGRYRSVSLGDAGHLSPDYGELEMASASTDGQSMADVKQEPGDLHNTDVYPRKHWDVMRQPSMESLGQEYEDISDDESEPDPTTACALCGQIFRNAKALHVHLYLEHQDGRTLPPDIPAGLEKHMPQTHPPCPVRIRSVSMSEDPTLSMEVRTSNFPSEVSVAMEMRGNAPAIAMEIRRRGGSYMVDVDRSSNNASTPIGSIDPRRAPLPGSIMPTDRRVSDIAEVGIVVEERNVNNIPVRNDCSLSASGKAHGGFEQSSRRTTIVQPQVSVHVHPPTDGGRHQFNCDLCEKHFSTRNSLKQHMMSHVQPRPFVCEQCDAGFISKEYLWHHLQTHSQERLLVTEQGNDVVGQDEIGGDHHSLVH